MNQNTGNTTTAAFKPWPTIGYGMAVYIGSTILGTAVLAFLSMVFVHEAVDMTPISEGEFTAEIAYYLLQLLCVSAVIGSAIIYYLTRTRLGPRTDAYLGIVAVSWKKMTPWLGMAAGFVVAGAIITAVYDMMAGPNPNIDPLEMLGPSVMLFVTVVIAVPMWEELLFRGFIFEGLRNSPMGTNGAIVMSSLWWAGLHMTYNLGGLIVILGFGLLLGLARARFGSVLLPIAMHGVYNGFILLLSGVTTGP